MKAPSRTSCDKHQPRWSLASVYGAKKLIAVNQDDVVVVAVACTGENQDVAVVVRCCCCPLRERSKMILLR